MIVCCHTERGVTANIPVLGTGDSGFESRRSDKICFSRSMLGFSESKSAFAKATARQRSPSLITHEQRRIKAGLVKWYNNSFPNCGREFDSRIPHNQGRC